jgi:hypothetical protein
VAEPRYCRRNVEQPWGLLGGTDVICVHRNEFCIGGISVEVTGDSVEDVSFVPSLEAFRASVSSSNITIQVKWTTELHEMLDRPVFDSGSVWSLYEKNGGLQFDFKTPLFGDRPYKRLIVDARFRQATLQMSESAFARFPRHAEPLQYPLDELLIMHRLTQERAIELHGCGIVTADGIGNLFVGHSGAGKSTTTRLWTAFQNAKILSDDRIIVRRDPAVGPSGEILMYGTPWHGEAAFASPASAPLKRICILEHGRGNILTQLSPSQAVAELFARSFVPFHRHEYLDSALEFLQEVVQAVPCYRFSFEPDQRAVETILSFHD